MGAGMEDPFFATGPVAQWGRPYHWCARRRLHNSVQRLEARILPGPCLFRGSSVFWGGFVVLRWLPTLCEHLAKELVLSYFTIITTIIFNNINNTKKNIKLEGAPCEVYTLQEAPTTNDS